MQKRTKPRAWSTVINFVVPECKTLNVRIPQGDSCLGQLLFIVYVNDIFLLSKIKLRFFADNACLSFQNCDSDLLYYKYEIAKNDEFF